ncbi:hypothetical protein CON22_26025 [Bacillus cereus]|nr:hypothetical protein CON22_26025 [Bacillus cereus]
MCVQYSSNVKLRKYLKAECFNLNSFRSVEEVKLSVHKYIHFYNYQRFQKKFKNLNPYEYRTQVS